MKILYIGQDSGTAGFAARALHGIAQDVAVTWAETPRSALQWLQANREAAAVIVEVRARNCTAFVRQLRDLGLTTPVVVVAESVQLEPALAAINAGVDGYVLAGPSLDADLPRTLTLAIDRERSRQEFFTRSLTELRAERDQARERVARADDAREQTERRCASELAAAAAKLADVQAGQTAALARDARICSALQDRLFELEGALGGAEERYASERVAVADQLAKRYAEFTASLERTSQSRDSLAAQLSAATAALGEAQEARRADAAAAAERLHRREAELGVALTEADAARATLEQALAEAEADKHEAHQRHILELGRAEAQIAELQTRYDAALAEHAGARAAFDRQFAEAASALDRAAQERASEAAAAAAHIARRESELGARLEDAAAANAALEDALLEAQRAHQHAVQRAAADLASAAERESALDDRLSLVIDRVRSLERQLSNAETARRDLDTRCATLVGQLTGESNARAALDRELGHARAELQRVSAEYARHLQSFNGLQNAFQALEQIAGHHAAEHARLETVVADRDSDLNAQAERHRIALEAAHEQYAQLQETLRQALEASDSDVARLQRTIDSLGRELDATRRQAEGLRRQAERVPDLQAQVELAQKERRREFERAPHGLCRCTAAGVITDANHSFGAMIGRRRADELRNMDFATVVSDCAGDVGWLLERTRTTRKTEAVETNWKTRDGRNLVVRLQALATTTGAVEVVAEDITTVRALEERLRQAQRMEAVGRLAAEAAVTCEAMLRDVVRGAHEWVAALGRDNALRQHGERLAADVTRAAGFLHQLGAYGNKVRTLEPVSVQRVLRDLEPVLKRVVGDHIELVSSKSSGSFDVDVEAERLERVLVNVAAYARQRMPRGGQMRIDLATTAVGRRFVARYPNVRPGDHVLITVTELPGGGELLDAERASQCSDMPCVDLGALVELIGTCGGHLWMEAQPAGNMVVKIHLPKRAPGAAIEMRSEGVGPERGTRLVRWFRSTSGKNRLHA